MLLSLLYNCSIVKVCSKPHLVLRKKKRKTQTITTHCEEQSIDNHPNKEDLIHKQRMKSK